MDLIILSFNDDQNTLNTLSADEEISHYRDDEQIIVELLNEPHSVKIPQVDFVLVSYKYLNENQLILLKCFHVSLT